jgi:hypothetical protein
VIVMIVLMLDLFVDFFSRACFARFSLSKKKRVQGAFAPT